MAGKRTESLRLGGVAPDFEADTTQGRIKFYDYLGNDWGLLLCYPDDFTPVATTELVLFSHLQKQFAMRKVKLLVLSTENQPIAENGESAYVPHDDWVNDVNDIGPVPMKFPIVKDRTGELSHLYHILDEEDIDNLNADNELTTGAVFNSRTIYVIGPKWESKHHIRMILQYPYTVGFNTGDVLRIIDALQLSDSACVRTPANWAAGGDVVVRPSMDDDEAKSRFPNFKAVKPYLRFVEMPTKDTGMQFMFFKEGALASFGAAIEDGVMVVAEGTEQHSIESMA